MRLNKEINKMKEKMITQLVPVTIQENKEGIIDNVIYHMKGTGALVVWNKEHKRWLYIVGDKSEFMPLEEVRLLFNNIRDNILDIAKQRQWTNISSTAFFGSKY